MQPIFTLKVKIVKIESIVIFFNDIFAVVF
jgi:hypothetical protein